MFNSTQKRDKLHWQTRQQYIERYFSSIRQQYMQKPSCSLNAQMKQSNILRHKQQNKQNLQSRGQKSWGYLFDQLKNCTNIYNQIHCFNLPDQVIQAALRRVIDELEYRVLVKNYNQQANSEPQQSIIIILILIFRELYNKCDARNRDKYMEKIIKIIDELNLSENVKKMINIGNPKQITN